MTTQLLMLYQTLDSDQLSGCHSFNISELVRRCRGNNPADVPADILFCYLLILTYIKIRNTNENKKAKNK